MKLGFKNATVSKTDDLDSLENLWGGKQAAADLLQ